MKEFTTKDVENYYDQTEVHYRMFWKLEKSLGLHYGVWDDHTRSLDASIVNTNALLMEMGAIKEGDVVLDAGCGIGGSAIFLAQQKGCKVTGITLSKKQVRSAERYAAEKGVDHLVDFAQLDFTQTGFFSNHFDAVWAIESMQTASDKALFFQEISRILKPGGRLLIADCFKSYPYDIEQEKDMQTMLHGWAISDLITIDQLRATAGAYDLEIRQHRDVTGEVAPSVRRIYLASLAGMIGTKLYNLYRTASYFSRIHYKTGLAQYRTYRKNQWGYHLLRLEKKG
jgi:cyclopropane fatty-acyl-phospholipid synthase-like methyltransferase